MNGLQLKKRTRANSKPTSRVGQHNKTQQSPYNTNNASIHQSEHKEQENHHAMLENLREALSKDHPLIWYVSKTDRHVAGHIIAERRTSNGGVCLVKTMTNRLILTNDYYITRSVPSDISSKDVEWMIGYLHNLTSDFEVRANIIVLTEEWGFVRSTLKKTVHEIIVEEWRLPERADSEFIDVKNASVVDQWHSCPVTSLKLTLPSVAAVSSADAEALRRCQDDLDRSENENRKLQNKLGEQRAVSERLESTISEERRNHEREISDLQAQSNQQIRTLKTNSSKKEKQIRNLNQNLTKNRSRIEQLERAKERKESELHEVQEQLRLQKNEAKRQATESQREVDELTRTISAYEATQLGQKQEIQTLREDSDRNYRKVKQLEEILPAYEHQEQVLAAEREKNKELQNLVHEKAQKLSELLGNSLISIYSGLNFGSEMTELRNEKHDEAVDACVDDLNIPQEEALDLLFRIFMFCCEYFEGKMARFRSAWNLDGNENLERLFIIKMQENYKAMFDGEGLKRAYLETFSQELGHGCTDHRILAYVHACGALCWIVVLHLPKLGFFPRERTIDPDEEVMFDSDKFKDFAGSVRKHGKARVVSYVLPGLYRIDSDVAISKDAVPCVFTRKIIPTRAKPKKESVVVSNVVSPRVTTSEVPEVDRETLLEDIQTDVWNGDVADAKQKLASIKWWTPSVKILCGDESCDAVLFHQWSDYERAVRNDEFLQCPVDDAHDGVQIRKKW